MRLTASRYIFMAAGAIMVAVVVILVLAAGRGTDGDTGVVQPLSDGPGFTFLGLGGDTIYSKSLRRQLVDRLGSDAIENRGVLDLNTNLQGLLEEHLPFLAQLQRELNSPPGERVEHGMTALTYRHVAENRLPFDRAQLFFSNDSGHPLLFKVRGNADAGNLPATLERKYGASRIVQWQNEGQNTYVDKGSARIWSADTQVLVLTENVDRLGILRYQVFFYYLDALRALVATERNQAQNRTPVEETAF